jgi:hypothetical protein
VYGECFWSKRGSPGLFVESRYPRNLPLRSIGRRSIERRIKRVCTGNAPLIFKRSDGPHSIASCRMEVFA